MITVNLYVAAQDGSTVSDDELEDWGGFRFAALPRVGDRFSVWWKRRLAVLEIAGVNQTPVPAIPSEEHEPVWPPEYGAPAVYVSARLVGGAAECA